ncbi:MAG: YjjG family noncanonical pyrimidine nucleotidase [Candidatus Cloacimonadales bacterium]|nr:YjjG family noncanonical pyrimidine nucleotidase [Candidatus Cloacimonadales bacterium]
MKYKLILFDADGTLFNFDKAEWEAFEKTMRKFGIRENLNTLHSEYEKINKAVWKEFEEKKISSAKLRVERFRRFFENQKLDLNPKEISPAYLVNLAQGIDLLEGAEEIVSYFHGKCELALATNGLAEVQRPRFANSRLAKYFQHIFISEEIGFPKPNREFFEYIFAELPYKYSAIIVGDNLTSDIQGGVDFGIDSCWYNPKNLKNETSIKPTYEIHELAELKNIIKF